MALTEMNIGNVLRAQGDNENALVHLQKALLIQEVALGPSHIDVAKSEGNIGLVYKQLGEYDKALFHLNRAHDIFIRSLGPDHHYTQQAARDIEQL